MNALKELSIVAAAAKPIFATSSSSSPATIDVAAKAEKSKAQALATALGKF